MDEDRFWAKVDKSAGPDGCWPWTGSMNAGGYGRFWINGGTPNSHRIAWIFANGTIPAGLHVLHRCDNPRCVNPAHLFLGTNAENALDRDVKGRMRTNVSRLTEEDVREIRKLHEQGVPSAVLASRYGVTPGNIWLVWARKAWKHVD